MNIYGLGEDCQQVKISIFWLVIHQILDAEAKVEVLVGFVVGGKFQGLGGQGQGVGALGDAFVGKCCLIGEVGPVGL